VAPPRLEVGREHDEHLLQAHLDHQFDEPLDGRFAPQLDETDELEDIA
jgi:hypothetical protein